MPLMDKVTCTRALPAGCSAPNSDVRRPPTRDTSSSSLLPDASSLLANQRRMAERVPGTAHVNAIYWNIFQFGVDRECSSQGPGQSGDGQEGIRS